MKDRNNFLQKQKLTVKNNRLTDIMFLRKVLLSAEIAYFCRSIFLPIIWQKSSAETVVSFSLIHEQNTLPNLTRICISKNCIPP